MKKFSSAAAIVIVLVVLLPVLYFSSERGIHPGHIGRMKLPVGAGKPGICFGFSHGFILATDGSLWAWGESQLGFPAIGLGKIETQPCLRHMDQGYDWISIATCESHGLAVKADGTLWAWGQNLHYQLGDGTRITRNTPVHSVAGNDWRQVAAGAAHSVALKRDGTLWAWGNNWAGQLGIDTLADSASPAPVGSGTNWVRVWSGGIHTIGLQSGGTLWQWGENPALPNQLRYSRQNFIAPVLLSSDTNWVQLSMWESMAVAVKSDGTLWACGRSALTFTGATDVASEAVMTRIGTDHDWKLCATGRCYVLASKTDGSLWAFDASHDQHTIKYTRINLPKDVIAIGAARGGVGGEWGSSGIGVALTREGEVWTWGMAYGEGGGTNQALAAFARVANAFGAKIKLSTRPNKIYDQPWQLGNVDADGGVTK